MCAVHIRVDSTELSRLVVPLYVPSLNFFLSLSLSSLTSRSLCVSLAGLL